VGDLEVAVGECRRSRPKRDLGYPAVVCDYVGRAVHHAIGRNRGFIPARAGSTVGRTAAPPPPWLHSARPGSTHTQRRRSSLGSLHPRSRGGRRRAHRAVVGAVTGLAVVVALAEMDLLDAAESGVQSPVR
jgi:hypothetical protein